jgi:flagellar basal-body rod protein FlgB
MEAASAILIVKALDGLNARFKVASENVANAGTPGYRPMRVTFEKALADAAAQGPDAVKAVTPQIERIPAGSPDAELRLDLEVADASATAGRYASLVELLGREQQLTSLAITGNP